MYTRAGPEIAVASTKAYTVQCALLYLFALRLALAKGKLSESEVAQICADMLSEIPTSIDKALCLEQEIMNLAKGFVNAEHLFFIGRGIDYQTAVEASLKLKEISYIHSEAYAAGELKHGTISLITDGTPVIAIITDHNLCEKTISGIREVKARGARVLAVCSESLAKKQDIPCDEILTIPDTQGDFSLFPTATALQLLAYSVSYAKGLNVDKPRNLAKSVTVE
jgi:glucosamine--fructose-6-phosphate aminotransferase (isomerizing)